ncbi:TRAP transporter permease [Anaerobacillus sp. MEB173]|uniref:TRAP transporter permease n=1 Tax=Anaerobacillus sp. MEB173 TaxID=3383345 RepID=UPI003F902981
MFQQLYNQFLKLFEVENHSDRSKTRQLSTPYLLILGIVGFSWALFHIYTMGFGSLPGIIQRSIHLGGAIFLCFIMYACHSRLQKNRVLFTVDVIFAILAVAITVYMIVIYPRIVEHHGVYNNLDIVLGTILLLLVVEGARRTLGWVIPGLIIVALFYTFFGPMFPGIWAHPGVDYGRFIQVFMLGTQGVWGQLMSISANVLVIFILYGSLILYLGLGDTFFDIGKKLTGRWRGGGAQMACVTSAFFGTINGSAVANVATTGNFTIPLMKRLGYNRNFAGAVESMASAGGQFMPPVMGAGAFLMAELLGINYIHVAMAALIPALLFFISLMISINFYAKKNGLHGVPKDEIPTWKVAFNWRKTVPLFIPMVIMVYLMIKGYTAGTAGYFAFVATAVLYLVCNVTSIESFKDTLSRLFVSIGRGARNMVTIVMLIGAAQTLVMAINISGAGVKFSTVVMTMSQGMLLPALLLAMVITVILGMGAPTPAAYVLAASVVGPALISMGIEGLTAHLFLYYFASLSAVTPPVCAAVFVACGISQGSWGKTALQGLRIGIVAFIIPFMFVYNPVLLMNGEFHQILLSFITALVGVLILAAGTMGIVILPTTKFERLLALVTAFSLIIPGWGTDLLGVSLLTILVILHWRRVKSSQQNSQTLNLIAKS